MTLRPKWYGPAPCRNCRADAVPWPVLAGIWGPLQAFGRMTPENAGVRLSSQRQTDSSQRSSRASLITTVKTDSFKNEKACVFHHNRQDGRFQKTFEGEMAARPKGCGEMRLSQDLRRRQSATARSTLTSPITIGGPSTRIRCDEAIRWFRSLTISRTDSSSGTSASVS
jgi:hypothetical protein